MSSFSRDSVIHCLYSIMACVYKCNCTCCWSLHCKSTRAVFLLISISQKLKLTCSRASVLLLLSLSCQQCLSASFLLPVLGSLEPVGSPECCRGRKHHSLQCTPEFYWSSCVGRVFTTPAQRRARDMWLRHSNPQSNRF